MKYIFIQEPVRCILEKITRQAEMLLELLSYEYDIREDFKLKCIHSVSTMSN